MIIKAISLWQPWASTSAMERELKRNETRSWLTGYRGPLAIHAAKKLFRARDYSLPFADRVRKDGLLDERIIYGAVVCIVDLVDCVRTESVRGKISETEQFYGDYSDGRFAWITKNLYRFPAAFPAVGHQGLFDWELPGVLTEHYAAVAQPSPQRGLAF